MPPAYNKLSGEQRAPAAKVPRIVYRRIRRPLVEFEFNGSNGDSVLTSEVWRNAERSCELSALRAQNHATSIAAQTHLNARLQPFTVVAAQGDVCETGNKRMLVANGSDCAAAFRRLFQTKEYAETLNGINSGRHSAITEDLNGLVAARDWLRLHKALASAAHSDTFNTALSNCTSDGYFPVHVAAQHDDVISFALLLAYGANVSSCSKNEQLTPFLIAAERGNLPLLMFIVSTVKSLSGVVPADRSTRNDPSLQPNQVCDAVESPSISSLPTSPAAPVPSGSSKKAFLSVLGSSKSYPTMPKSTGARRARKDAARPASPVRNPSLLFPGMSRMQRSGAAKSPAKPNELIKLFENHDVTGSNVFHFLLAHQSVEPLMYIINEMRSIGYDPTSLLLERDEHGETPLTIALNRSPYNAEFERYIGNPIDHSLHGRCHASGLTVFEALRYELGLDIAALQRRAQFSSASNGAFSGSSVNSPAAAGVDAGAAVQTDFAVAADRIGQQLDAAENIKIKPQQHKLPLLEAMRRKLSYTVQHFVEIGCDPLEREKPRYNALSTEKDEEDEVKSPAGTPPASCMPSSSSFVRRNSSSSKLVDSYDTHLHLGCNAFDAALMDGSFDAMRALCFPVLYADRRVRWPHFPFIFPDSARRIYMRYANAGSAIEPPFFNNPASPVLQRSERDVLLVDQASRLRSRVWVQRSEQIVSRDITHDHAPRPIRAINDVDSTLYPEDHRYLGKNGKRWASGVAFSTFDGNAACKCSLHGCTTYTCECAGLLRRDQFDQYGRIPGIIAQKHSAFVFECNMLCTCHARQCRNRCAQLLRGDVNIRLELVMTRRKGWGVCTIQPLRAGHIVGVMAGMYFDYWDAASNGKYSLTLTSILPDEAVASEYGDECYANDFVLECLVAGNIGRYFNHSCAPNCEMLPFQNADDISVPSHTALPTMVIVAKQHIKSGSELTWFYSENYWLSGDFGQCRCGASTCVSKPTKGKQQRRPSLVANRSGKSTCKLKLCLECSILHAKDEPCSLPAKTRPKRDNFMPTKNVVAEPRSVSRPTGGIREGGRNKHAKLLVTDDAQRPVPAFFGVADDDEFNFCGEGDVELSSLVFPQGDDGGSGSVPQHTSENGTRVSSPSVKRGESVDTSVSTTSNRTEGHSGSDNLLPHACKYPGCSKSFRRLPALQSHVEQVHVNTRPADVQRSVCTECGARLKNAVELIQHALVHQARFVRPQVPSFSAVSVKAAVVADALPYKCFCGCAFINLAAITQHVDEHVTNGQMIEAHARQFISIVIKTVQK